MLSGDTTRFLGVLPGGDIKTNVTNPIRPFWDTCLSDRRYVAADRCGRFLALSFSSNLHLYLRPLAAPVISTPGNAGDAGRYRATGADDPQISRTSSNHRPIAGAAFGASSPVLVVNGS
jgi:hypothetical protein